MMNANNLTIALVGPLPPPEGGMANQAKLLCARLSDSGATVFFVRSNDSYRPHWVKNIKILRALFRLFFYILAVWKTAAQSTVISCAGKFWLVMVLVFGSRYCYRPTEKSTGDD